MYEALIARYGERPDSVVVAPEACPTCSGVLAVLNERRAAERKLLESDDHGPLVRVVAKSWFDR